MTNHANSDSRQPVTEIITARGGLSVTILDVGAAIQSIVVPLSGCNVDAIVSYGESSSYLTDSYFLGTTVGPVANRIRNATFELNGNEYRLDANDADRGHCLHGGSTGLHRQRFSLKRDENRQTIMCEAELAHGVGGFPGNRFFHVTYHLLDDWSLAIDFEVTTDRDTVINLANHAYFNLGGPLNDHRLRVFADLYTPVKDSMIPSGDLRDVRESKYDLRELQRLGDRKFDHNFVLGEYSRESRLAAQLESPSTELQLTVLTTQPAIQVYTGDYLSDPFHPRQGICLEAQGFPDAPNQPNFPSIRLEADGKYSHRTVYQFASLSKAPHSDHTISV